MADKKLVGALATGAAAFVFTMFMPTATPFTWGVAGAVTYYFVRMLDK